MTSLRTNGEAWGAFAGGLVLGIVATVPVVIALDPIAVGQRRVRIEAVQHGAAEWIVQPDGSTEFKWREPGEEEK